MSQLVSVREITTCPRDALSGCGNPEQELEHVAGTERLASGATVLCDVYIALI